jgi:dihydrofolate synthase/folylpolyglutamate synthase
VYFDDFKPEDRRILVVGTLRDADEMISALRADDFDVVIACTAPTPRGVEASVLGAAARAAGCLEVLVIDDPIAACEEALRRAGTEDAILVTGSIYVVGAVRRMLLRHSGR